MVSKEEGEEQVVLDVVEEDLELGGSSIRLCRICHEEEGEDAGDNSSAAGAATVGAGGLEAPCACSGTLKFAHRGCVQRWCNEKGSTLCEICLQNFEHDYIVAPRKALVDIGVTIRGSLEVPRLNYQVRNSTADDFDQCSPTTRGRASCCRTVAITITIMLLLRHAFSVVTLGTSSNYGFTLLIVFMLRAVGILLPLFCIMRLISAMERIHQHNQQLHEVSSEESLELIAEEGNLQLQHRIIGIN